MKGSSVYTLLMLVVVALGNAQTVDFQLPASVCEKEYVQFVNSSTKGSSLQWDFCAGGLESDYKVFAAGAATDLMTNLVIIEDNNLWYGFATSRNNVLVRIDFGADPNNAPLSTTSIGNPGNLLNSPESIDMVQEGSSWIALIGNAGNEIIRLTWTGAVTGTPVAESLNLNSFGKLNLPTEIEIKKDGNDYVALVANASGRSITMINFGNSLLNQPQAMDIQMSAPFPNATDLYGLSAVEQCGQWIIYAIGSNHIYRAVTGDTLYSLIMPADVQDFSADVPAIGSYNHIKAIASAENTYIYFTSYTLQSISAAIWRKGAAHGQGLDLGIPTLSYGTYGLDAVYFNGNYSLYVSGFLSGQLSHLVTTSPCSSNMRFSNVSTPQNIFYSQPGTTEVSLSVTLATGEVCSATKGLTINGSRSPQPAIQIDSICVASPITFTSVSSDSIPITQWNWMYGDGASQSGQKTFHQYSSQGTYVASLNVVGNNGCQNNIFKDLTVYSPPIASFTLPADSVCSNNVISISNTTQDVFNGNLSFAWKVNNKIVSTQTDFNTIIPAAGDNQLTLIASIPGCSTEDQQILAGVKTGPLPDFVFFNNCDGKATQFSNESTGAIYAQSWYFGDGHSSSAANPQNTFPGIGDYTVTLTDSSKNGCNNSVTKKVMVYSTPHPDFSLELPPFSCSGSPAQFDDNTPKMPDSNAITWSWTFGDAKSGTSNQQNPAYTYAAAGDFTAGLTVVTNFNCSATVQKSIKIAQSPTADFSAGPACLDQNTQFTDLSGPTTKSRSWKITGGTTNFPASSIANPVYVFPSLTTYNVALTIIDNDGCIAQATKAVVVPPPLVPEFSFQHPCAGQATFFNNITAANSDPQVWSTWNFNNQGTATGLTASFTFTSAANVAVAMTAAAQSGCSYTLTKMISIVAPPVAGFTIPTTSGAPPLKLQFTNTSTNASSYLWNFNDASHSSSALTSPSFSYTSPGEYTAMLTAFGVQNCTDTISRKISVIEPFADLALSDLKLLADPLTEGYKINVTVSNNGNSTISNPPVIIRTSDNTVREVLAIKLAPYQATAFTLHNELSSSPTSYVCVTLDDTVDSNMLNNEVCTDLATQDVILSPYPNPAKADMFIDWIAVQENTAIISVYSSIGQIMIEPTEYSAAPGLNHCAIDVSSLHAGIYLVLFKHAGTQKTFRFVVN